MRRYPETRREEVVDVLHGTSVADPYRWLEDGEADEVRAWTRAQGDYTREVLERAPFRAALRQRPG